jgi:hypothetical protein
MTNNKQQTAVEWLEQEMLKPNLSMKEILEQAKEMEKEQRSIEVPSDEEIEEKLNVAYGNGYEQGEMDFYKKMQMEGNQYADGYKEGYKRALEMIEWYIKNYISGMPQDHIVDTNKRVGGVEQ